MTRNLFLATIVVPDYDRAIEYYRDILGFTLAADTPLGGGKRWVVVKPDETNGAGLLLAKAKGDRQVQAIGNQTGGRVSFFLQTDDFDRDHALYRSRGVEFMEEPRHEDYGTVAVFRDAFGNMWDLIEPAPSV
ncbi:VOC family protein [Rhizobium sp. KVB221]|uniref:VOC family protein n=1 Tax=Rhizobium setariae TaxID=2801340 RepID=A0A936YQH6_9HYPH|nr:VOC family protein [Rhizobium setariae]MBL0372656.1 VOC family protein [Rhizobium setariae]